MAHLKKTLFFIIKGIIANFYQQKDSLFTQMWGLQNNGFFMFFEEVNTMYSLTVSTDKIPIFNNDFIPL